LKKRPLIHNELAVFFHAQIMHDVTPSVVPSPGSATLWPSVAHALITSPEASQHACAQLLSL